MRYYFKKTLCGMVLMILKEWDDEGRTCGKYCKATEAETTEFMCTLMGEKE